LFGGTGDNVFGLRDNLESIERIEGNGGHDVIEGASTRDVWDFSITLLGPSLIRWWLSSSDVLVLRCGEDQLIGGAGADTFALTAADFRLDTIYDFSGAGGDSDVIDLEAFGAKASESVSYDPKSQILTVNGEDVAKIRGDFDPATDIVNHAPVAEDDSFTTNEDTEATLNVLSKDGDVDGDTLTVTAVGVADHGAAVLNDDGTINFIPHADYHGNATFSYQVADRQGGLWPSDSHRYCRSGQRRPPGHE